MYTTILQLKSPCFAVRPTHRFEVAPKPSLLQWPFSGKPGLVSFLLVSSFTHPKKRAFGDKWHQFIYEPADALPVTQPMALKQ